MEKENYQHLAKNISPEENLEIVKGEGVFVYDRNGNRYFDLSSQTANLNLGHRHPVIMSAIEEYLKSEKPYFLSSRWQSPVMADLAAKLVELAPEGMIKANVKLCNGSDAVEDAFKRARRFHKKGGKEIIVTQYRSHHGESSETISASGKHFLEKKELGGSGKYLHISPAYLYHKPRCFNEETYTARTVNEFLSLVKKQGNVSAIALELIQVTGGVIVQPKSYVQGIEKICRENNITFIVDEVQTAFGWIGTMFASDYYDIKPDIIALGKGITAGFPALAATVFREEYDNLNYGESEFTNGGEPLACQAALANINYLQTSGILNTIPEKHNHFIRRLTKMKEKYKQIGDVRGLGLILGMEFVKENRGGDYETMKKVYHTALANNLILRPSDCDGKLRNVLIIKTPIIISHDEIEESMNLLDKSLEECLL